MRENGVVHGIILNFVDKKLLSSETVINSKHHGQGSLADVGSRWIFYAVDKKIAQKLKDLYRHPDQVELYPGLVCEGQGRCLDPGTKGPKKQETALWPKNVALRDGLATSVSRTSTSIPASKNKSFDRIDGPSFILNFLFIVPDL